MRRGVFMREIGLHEIREEFLNFFKEKDHLIVPSYSLIPKNDKSLLLIGAGMAPMKKFFTGEAKPPKQRMASCQKCIRTGDIENVGMTDRHATFFEMLGNFSFGDYFKKEAIEWAWEFLADKMEIAEEDMWVSVYKDDEEAYNIWKDHMNVPAERIVKLGKDDNFWELEVGPSGPCSEIYVDRGAEYGCGAKDCRPGCECDRFLEVWNLVFTQFDKDEQGNYNPLAHPNIDTGMGLERIAALSQKADNIFEIKEIRSIINKIEDLSNYKYGNDDKKDISIRVITDHARAMTFLVSDGVLPSNEGRGYVLRRLIRRAARHGKLLGIEGEFLAEIVKEVIDSWKVAYKDLVTRQEQIERVIKAEEDKFQETIDQGIFILENYIKEMEDEGQKILDGDKAFKLYDTYGFPIDLTKEILEEKSLSVNLVEFNTKMEEQRDRARRARQEINSGWKDNQLNDLLKDLESSFTGYEEIKTHTEIIGLFKDNERVGVLEREDEGILILKKTPFYGEAGGQVGDIGVIYNENFTAKVLDTSLSNNDLTLHMVKLKKGSVAEGDKVVAKVEDLNRDSIKRNHSATHLLHKALKEVLGEHVNQAGSLVLPNRLRFDFTHFEAVSQRELEEIENRVNEKILKALTVSTEVTSLDRAEKLGAIGLFEDKYEDEVRVVKMGDYSIELCGGTHVDNTANIGLFKIISEGGIASGVRRIEAITGLEVYNYLKELEKDMDKLTVVLKTNREYLQDKASSMVEELRDKDREIEKLKAKLATDIAKDIIEEAKYVEDIPIVSYKTDSMDVNALRNLGDEIRNRLDSAVVVLASTQNSKLVFISMVTKDLIDKGILAGNLVREVAKVTGGNGGGRPDMAQAGGKDISKLDEALDLVPDLVKKQLK